MSTTRKKVKSAVRRLFATAIKRYAALNKKFQELSRRELGSAACEAAEEELLRSLEGFRTAEALAHTPFGGGDDLLGAWLCSHPENPAGIIHLGHDISWREADEAAKHARVTGSWALCPACQKGSRLRIVTHEPLLDGKGNPVGYLSEQLLVCEACFELSVVGVWRSHRPIVAVIGK